MTPSVQTDLIRQAADLAAVIQSYGVPLRRAGARLVAPCPFHQDTAPSLSVSPAKQLWYCFGGCGGGDVFNFIRRIEGCDFRRARQIAAEHAGIAIAEERPTRQQVQDLRRARELAAEAEYFSVRERNTLGIRHGELAPTRIMGEYLRRCAAYPGYREWLRQDRREAEDLAALCVAWLALPDTGQSICRCGARYVRAEAHWRDGDPWCSAACAATSSSCSTSPSPIEDPHEHAQP